MNDLSSHEGAEDRYLVSLPSQLQRSALWLAVVYSSADKASLDHFNVAAKPYWLMLGKE